MTRKRDRHQRAQVHSASDGKRRGIRRIVWCAVGMLTLVTAVALISRTFFTTSPAVRPEIASKVWTFDERGLAADATAAEMKAEAHTIANNVVTAHPDSAEALGVQARNYLRFRDEKAAESSWRQALKLEPGSIQALFGLGLIGLARDDYELAIESFSRASQLGYQDPRLPTALAEAHLKSGQVDQAIQVLEQAIASRTASIETLLTLGQACVEAEDFEQAVRHFEAVLELDPHRREAMYSLGRVHVRLGNRKEGAEWLQRHRKSATHKVSEADSASNEEVEDRRATRESLTQVCIDAGHVYRALGNSEQAEVAWQKAVTIAPNEVETHAELFAMYESDGQYRKAIVTAMRLSELEPNNAGHWLNIGALSAELSLHEQAIAAIDKAIKLDPDNPRCRKAYELIRTP